MIGQLRQLITIKDRRSIRRTRHNPILPECHSFDTRVEAVKIRQYFCEGLFPFAPYNNINMREIFQNIPVIERRMNAAQNNADIFINLLR